MKQNNKSGFTLLEIIIVIIIVGVLASLALPRFFSTVEFSKSTEALASMSSIRQSIERCFLASAGTYVGCDIDTIDLENPGNSPGTHWTYVVSNQAVDTYDVIATRNSYDGGVAGDTITISQDANGVTKVGTGPFIGIR